MNNLGRTPSFTKLTYGEYVGLPPESIEQRQHLSERMDHFELGYLLSGLAEADVVRLGLLSEDEPQPASELSKRYSKIANLGSQRYFESTLLDDFSRLPQGMVRMQAEPTGQTWITRTPMGTTLAGLGGDLLEDVVMPYDTSLRGIFGSPQRHLTPDSLGTNYEELPILGPIRTLVTLALFTANPRSMSVNEVITKLGKQDIEVSDSTLKEHLKRLEASKILRRTGKRKGIGGAILWNTTSDGDEIIYTLANNIQGVVARSPEKTTRGLDRLAAFIDDPKRRARLPHIIKQASLVTKDRKKPSRLQHINDQLAALSTRVDHSDQRFTTIELAQLMGDENIKHTQFTRLVSALGGSAVIRCLGKEGQHLIWAFNPTVVRTDARA